MDPRAAGTGRPVLAGFVTDAPDRLTGYRTREFAVLLSGLGTAQIALLRAITG